MYGNIARFRPEQIAYDRRKLGEAAAPLLPPTSQTRGSAPSSLAPSASCASSAAPLQKFDSISIGCTRAVFVPRWLRRSSRDYAGAFLYRPDSRSAEPLYKGRLYLRSGS